MRRLVWFLLLCFPIIIQSQALLDKKELSVRRYTSVEVHKNHTIDIFPIKIVKGLLLIEGAVNDKSGYFVLDTGAPDLIIHRSIFSQTTKASYKANSCCDELSLEMYEFDVVRWGNNIYKSRSFLTLNLDHLQHFTKHPILGLVGYEALKNKVIGLNLIKAKFYQANHIRCFQLIRAPKMVIPFELMAHVPIVNLNINGQNFEFAIDTGSADNLISESVFNQFFNKYLTSEQIHLQGLDQKSQKLESIQLDQILLDSLPRFNQIFRVINLEYLSKNNDINIDGIVGYPVLKDLIITFDYRASEISIWQF